MNYYNVVLTIQGHDHPYTVHAGGPIHAIEEALVKYFVLCGVSYLTAQAEVMRHHTGDTSTWVVHATEDGISTHPLGDPTHSHLVTA